MLQHLQAYFADEKAESLVFLAFGLVASIVALLLLFRSRDPLFKGLAIPLLVVGAIQVAVGLTIYARTDAQLAALTSQVAAEPTAFKSQELARMAKVQSSFNVYKGVEAAFILIGLVLALRRKAPRFWRGFGVGMLLQGALMLPADLIAEDRAMTYVGQIRAMP